MRCGDLDHIIRYDDKRDSYSCIYCGLARGGRDGLLFAGGYPVAPEAPWPPAWVTWDREGKYGH